MGIDQNLGALLRRVRESAGYTPETLAAMLGISRVQVNRIENGRRGTTLSVLEQWFDVCGYAVDAVSFGDASQTRAVAVALSQLDDDQVRNVVRLIRAWSELPPYVRDGINSQILGFEASHSPKRDP